jgi:hypothetical protein
MWDSAFVVLRQSSFEIIRQTDVALGGVRLALEEVNVVHGPN